MNQAIIIENRQLTDDVYELLLEPTKELNFKAGQFINIRIEDKMPPCFRAYSIASAPDKNKLAICFKLITNGRGSNWLVSRPVGTTLTFLGPAGNLFINPSAKKHLLIATGTGIAPFKSIVEDELAKKTTDEMFLIFGVRNMKNIFYQDHFDKLSKENPNFKFQITLSQAEEGWSGNQGRVTELLNKLELDTINTEAYICGLKEMVDDVKTLLIAKGFSEKNINFEKYD